MAPVINQEWLNRNSLRNYPFREDARLIPVDDQGIQITDIRLPNYLVVDCVLTVPTPSLALTLIDVHLAQFAKVANLMTFTFTDHDALNVATLAVDTAQHTKNQAYPIAGTGTYTDVRGKLVVGDLATLAADLPDGLYEFTATDGALESTVVRPDIRGVRSLQVDQDGTLSAYLFGHIKLVEGTNIRLTYIEEYNAIRIDAIDGSGLNEECECPDLEAQCVRLINGIPIEDAEIIGDGQCVSVTTEGNRIVISDTCSEPCCGCPELEFITENLKVLDATVSNLENYAHQLHQRISEFVTTFVLAVQGT